MQKKMALVEKCYLISGNTTMSKIGTKPINIDSTTQLTISDVMVEVKGPGGTIIINVPKGISLKRDGDMVNVVRVNDTPAMKALHGTIRSLVQNAVTGVSKMWERRLEIVGTGFKVRMDGENLHFDLGFSHPVVFQKIQGVTYSVEGGNKVKVSGIDKQLVGQVAHKIKSIKKPDPYKGKGIRYEGEKIKLKPGKKAKTAGAGK